MKLLLATSSLVWLVACGSSVKLPPWPENPVDPSSIAETETTTTPPEAVLVTPVQPPAAQPTQAPLPYSAAVAARFPEPHINYSTPGLQAGRSSFSSNAEVDQWLQTVTRQVNPASGTKAALLTLGSSQQGLPLQALVLTQAAGTDSLSLSESGRPTVLLVGQQHGNEPAGGEALLVLARELGSGLLEPLLAQINVIIVARANPDGAAALQRATANGVDMNRDHLLLLTPEAQALAQLAHDYQPAVVVDAHEYTAIGRFLEKFGALQRFDAMLQYATTANTPEFITKAAEEWFRRPVVKALDAEHLSSQWYYTTSTDPQDLRVSMGGTQPDTGRNIYGLRNAISLLVETRGIGLERLHIQRRVHTQVTALATVLKITAERAADLQQLRTYVEREVSELACKGQAVVEAGPTLGKFELLMIEPQTGADHRITVDWNSSLTLQTLKARARPCGYWLASDAGATVERLRQLGATVERLTEPGALLGENYQASSSSEGQRQDVRGSIAGGSAIKRVEVSLARQLIDVPSGSYYVGLNQPLGNLILAALEPDTQNSFYANHILEQLDSIARVMAEPSVARERLP